MYECWYIYVVYIYKSMSMQCDMMKSVQQAIGIGFNTI